MEQQTVSFEQKVQDFAQSEYGAIMAIVFIAIIVWIAKRRGFGSSHGDDSFWGGGDGDGGD